MAQIKRLKEALLAHSGVDFAATIKQLGGASDRAKMAETLRSAAMIMDDELQAESDVEAGVPPGAPTYLNGFYFGADQMTELQRALQHLVTADKGRLMCVSKYWRTAMSHPAFWKELRLPPSVLVSVKDATTFLDLRAAQFYGVTRFVWPAQVVWPGCGVMTRVLKLCKRIKAVDSGSYEMLHFFNGSSISSFKMSAGARVYRLINDLPVMILPGAEQAGLPDQRLIPCGFTLSLRESDGVVSAHPNWTFPELETLELQYLPAGLVYSAVNGTGGEHWLPHRPACVAETLACLIRAMPKLQSLVLRDAHQPSRCLEIDVAGMRSGHLPATYPNPEYIEYLKGFASLAMNV